MRIIAGRFRGRNLHAPDGRQTRPMTDKAKESIFNILGHRFGLPGHLPELDVLDLFAGSGGLGIEALSRGARSCLFVERDRRAIRALRSNIGPLGLGVRVGVLAGNAWTLRIPRLIGPGYGLIFVDPPFRDVEAPDYALGLLERLTPYLAPEGVIVFRHEVATVFPRDTLSGLVCRDLREFGRMKVLFFELRPAGPAPVTPHTPPPPPVLPLPPAPPLTADPPGAAT
jgi:16S rRNA (guanine966-N2)-methyltransferase